MSRDATNPPRLQEEWLIVSRPLSYRGGSQWTRRKLDGPKLYVRGLGRLVDKNPDLAKGEVAGSDPVFRSRETALQLGRRAGRSRRSVVSLPITAHHRHAVAMDAAKGSIRQRGSSSDELQVYGGTDPHPQAPLADADRRHGDRADARRELMAFARWVAYQPVPAIIDPLRWVPSIEPSFGASP